MKKQESKRWLWPPLEQLITVWGIKVVAVVAVVTSQILLFMSNLSETRWIWFYAVGLGFAVLGTVLILYAKLPLYRQRRFFTFGSRFLPESRRIYYRWGYRFFIVGAIVLAFLTFARQ